MDYFIDTMNEGLLQTGQPQDMPLNNWHASIADAMMAVGVLSDDRARYDRGVALYKVRPGVALLHRALFECALRSPNPSSHTGGRGERSVHTLRAAACISWGAAAGRAGARCSQRHEPATCRSEQHTRATCGNHASALKRDPTRAAAR